MAGCRKWRADGLAERRRRGRRVHVEDIVSISKGKGKEGIRKREKKERATKFQVDQ